MRKQAAFTSAAAAGTTISAATPTAPRLLDKRGVAELIGFSGRTINNLMNEGLPHMRIGTRRCRYEANEVLTWLRTKYGTQRRGTRTVRTV